MQPAFDYCAHSQSQGKTVVSSWLVRQPRVRQQFSQILWVTLGQTPDISAARSTLYVQLTGRSFPENTADADMKVLLAQAMSANKVISSHAHCTNLQLALKRWTTGTACAGRLLGT